MTQCWIFLIFLGCQTPLLTVMIHISSTVIFLASSLVIHQRNKMMMTDMRRNNLQKIFELRNLMSVSYQEFLNHSSHRFCYMQVSVGASCTGNFSTNWNCDEYIEKILSKFSIAAAWEICTVWTATFFYPLQIFEVMTFIAGNCRGNFYFE